MEAKKSLKIDDIAAAAGVSKATVSRYLNGRRDLLSEKTWERVRAVVEMTNYRPNDMASNLKKKVKNMVGVLISDISSPFSSALIIGITRYLDALGYSVLIAGSADSREKEEENIRSLLSKGVCGLLVNTASCENPALIQADCEGVPIVLMDRKVRNHSFPLVTSDHAAGMRMLIAYLHAQGYTRPVLFTQKWEDNSVRMERRESFLRGTEEICGYVPPEEDIYVLDAQKGQTAQVLLRRLMQSLRPGECPAIIGANSITTACAAHAIAAEGLSMPEQIGLCGPEDWDWSSELNWPCMIRPNVTTLRIHSTELGYQAAALLMELLHQKTRTPETRVIACELVERDSARRRN